jgi:hypothetical protein
MPMRRPTCDLCRNRCQTPSGDEINDGDDDDDDFSSKGHLYAKIVVNRKQIYLGSFVTYSDAVNARKNAEALYFNTNREGTDAHTDDNQPLLSI